MGNHETRPGRSNDELVDNLVKSDSVRKKEIELIMRLVDRGRFVPIEFREKAYRDNVWKSETGNPGFLHLSAPSIYANVLENFKLDKGMSFLNIGSGTGYLSTMVGFILGNNGVNHGIELYENVVKFAVDRVNLTLKSPEVSAFDWCVPQFFHCNVFQMKTDMRYDRIYCGALVPNSRRSYFCNMLKVNGIIIMPYGNTLEKIVRTSENQFVSYTISAVMFSQFVLPDDQNEVTSRSLQIPLLESPRLIDSCRNQIRCTIRQATYVNCPLEMKNLCPKKKQQEMPGSSRHIVRIRPLLAVGRRLYNVYLVLADAVEDVDAVGNNAQAENNEEERNQRVDRRAHQFLAMLGARVDRHHRARDRAANPNVVVNDREIMEQNDEDEPAPLVQDDPIGDAYFEMALGFRFKRGRSVEGDEVDEFDIGRAQFIARRNRRLQPPNNDEEDEEDADDEVHVINAHFEDDMESEHDVGGNDLNQDGEIDGVIMDGEIAIIEGGMEDGIGHALDEPIAEHEENDDEIGHALDEANEDGQDVLNDSFAESNATFDINELEVEEEHHEASDDSDDVDDHEADMDDAESSAHETSSHDEDDHLEEDASQIEATRQSTLQAHSLANFHKEFINRLNELPASLQLRRFLKYEYYN